MLSVISYEFRRKTVKRQKSREKQNSPDWPFRLQYLQRIFSLSLDFYRYNFSIATCWRNLSFKVLSWKIFPASCVGGSHCETCKCLMFPCKRANTKNTLFNLTRICLLSLFQQGLIKLSRFWKGTNMTWNLSLLSAYIAKYLFLQCYLSILGQIDRPQVHSFTSEGTNKSPYEFSRKSGFNGIFNSLKYLSLKFPNFRKGSIWMKAEVTD